MAYSLAKNRSNQQIDQITIDCLCILGILWLTPIYYTKASPQTTLAHLLE